MTLTIRVNDLDVNLQTICDLLCEGKCIGLPTETVYGLAADATNGRAVARIFEMKGRPKFNPLICHVSGMEMAREYGRFDPVSEKLAQAFWPGPLTIVLPLAEGTKVHPLVSAGLDTIGLRCPEGPARDVIASFGKPLAAPSANRSGKISPTTAKHVSQQFPDAELMIVDAGRCAVGIESTIVKIDDGNICLLRPGAITSEMIAEVSGVIPVATVSNKIEAPGMMESHYAPDAAVILNCDSCPSDAALLKFGNRMPNAASPVSLNLSETGDLVEAAANLYAYVKQLDESGISKICVEPIPMEGLGIAINDRLTRSAAPRGIT
ncbi:MAG: L-threonylcarbamoyladenylate synthase [Pseudomonadota bacterium]